MYQFSAPMPYTIDDIQKLININNQIEKSRITSLYACVPRGCEVFTGFEQSRNISVDNVSWDYWKNLIEFTLSQGCDFIYLLNSPRPLDIENSEFTKQLEKLDFLLSELKNMGVNKLRLASGQLMAYINKYYPDFQILASTSLEYKTICEYQNFLYFHGEVKQIVPSCELNRNFKMLSHLRKHYPNVEIELMVNEGCLQGCPNRMLHQYISIDRTKTINDDICLSQNYATSFCFPITTKYPVQSMVMGNLIFPWDIEEYSKIGINNFKFVGRECFEDFDSYLYGYTMYLKGTDNIKAIENDYLTAFSHHLRTNPVLKKLTIKEYKKYLPKINYFKKYGYLCGGNCGVECHYCYKCADKIQKVFRQKQKNEQIKSDVPV